MTLEPTNKDRAKWAQSGLNRFAKETGLVPKDDGYDTVISDFLADIMHFCTIHAIDFSNCLRVGTNHFNEEIEEERTINFEEEEGKPS